MSKNLSTLIGTISVSFMGVACSSGLPADNGGTKASGGAAGNSAHSGGSTSNVGGTTATSSQGGATGSGGLNNTAGTSNAGGSQAVGGTTGAAGASNGGATNTGGTSTLGGSSNVAGTTATGGTNALGGATNSGGTPGVGGAPNTGGAGATGGGSSLGGTANTGGVSNTGGAATGGSPATGGSSSTSAITGGSPATGGAATGGAATGGEATGGAATGGSPTGGAATGGAGTGGDATGGAGPCNTGDICTPTNSCHVWTVDCTSGSAVCTDTGQATQNGTSCGTNQVCNSGSCVACTAGASCTSPDPCGTATTSCSLGVQTCQITGPASGKQGQNCGMSGTGACSAQGVCQCPSGQAYYQGDCQVCPAFTQAVAYVNADPTIGVDNACCGRVQQTGFGGPCLTVGQAIEVAPDSSTVNVAGDALGNASSLEQYPIHLRRGLSITGSSANVCFRGASNIPVFAAIDDDTTTNLTNVIIGATCQGDPGGASAGLFVSKTASNAIPTVTLDPHLTIERVGNGIHVIGGNVTMQPSFNWGYCGEFISINQVTNGIVVDGGTVTCGATITNASNAGVLCQSVTDPQSTSNLATACNAAYSGSVAISAASVYDVFAGTGCRTAASFVVQLGTMSGTCPSPKTDRFGIYSEGDAQISTSGTIRCMSEDAISLRANSALTVNAPQVTFSSGALEHSGCTGAYAEVGRLTVFGSNVMYNHTGVVQRSPQSSTDGTNSVVNLAGTNNGTAAMNTFKCNGKAEPGLCCTSSSCPNGFDVWNNSGLPLDATSNYWRAAPVSQCICDEALQTCTCSGSAYGQTTPPDGLDILRSPFQGSNTGTVNITGYALVSDPTCPG